jgi:hypothetical protein
MFHAVRRHRRRPARVGGVGWGRAAVGSRIEGPGDAALYHKWYGNAGSLHPATTWSPWADQGGGLAGPPGAVSWGSERQDVFVTGTDGNMYHTWEP